MKVDDFYKRLHIGKEHLKIEKKENETDNT
jgi:hypothetical protein